MMAPVLAIWRQPVAERRARGSLGLSWALLALALLGTLSLGMASPSHLVLFAFFTGVPMGMLLIIWWIYLCASVATQCHPAALQLVPGLAVRVQCAVILAWLGIVGIMTLLVGVPGGHAALVALITALVLIETGVMGSVARYAVIGVAGWALSHAGPAVTQWLGSLIATPAAMAAGAMLVLLDGAVALRRLGRGSHAGSGRNHTAHALTLRVPVSRAGGRSAGWLERGADPQPVYLHALGRSWFSLHLFTVAMVVLVCAGLRLWTIWNGQAEIHTVLAGNRTVLAIALFGVLGLVVYQESQRFARARCEQGLLCLTPAAPLRSSMNCLLARGMLTGFLRSWLVLCMLSMLALALLGAQMSELARLAAAWVPAMLLGSVGLRDMAQAESRVGRPSAGLSLSLLVAVLAGIGAVAINGHGAAGRWLVLAGMGLLASLAVARWRWHAMLAAPPALPAGRIQAGFLHPVLAPASLQQGDKKR